LSKLAKAVAISTGLKLWKEEIASPGHVKGVANEEKREELIHGSFFCNNSLILDLSKNAVSTDRVFKNHMASYSATYISANSFSVPGDVTDDFITNELDS